MNPFCAYLRYYYPTCTTTDADAIPPPPKGLEWRVWQRLVVAPVDGRRGGGEAYGNLCYVGREEGRKVIVLLPPPGGGGGACLIQNGDERSDLSNALFAYNN